VHIETLQTFCHLVETGSFTKAARLGFISQSAVSQQLKTLEARYGRPLIERGARRRLAPTEAGRLLYAECRELLDRFRQLEARLREPPDAVAGTVRLATVYSIGLHELPPYVTRFMQAHPRVKVHVEYTRTDKVCDACVDGTVDFGIVAFPLRRSNLTVIPWHEERLVLACAPTHRLARRRTVRLAELDGEPFIAFERDIPTRKTIDRVLRALRVAVDTVMEFDNVETIKRSVEVGTGLSILPATTVTREVKGRTLATANFAEGPFKREVGIIHRRGRVLSAAAQGFVRLLVGGRQQR
jgi:DNA-binding transcriptional LysR family regulator